MNVFARRYGQIVPVFAFGVIVCVGSPPTFFYSLAFGLVKQTKAKDRF